MIKHTRTDLTIAHLVARSGIKKTFDTIDLTSPNKNYWLPVHLSKNKEIAEFLMDLTKPLLPLDSILLPAIKNNTQSIQTQYGNDLEEFLIEQGFSKQDAKNAATEPTNFERINLSLYFLNLVEPSMISKFDFNPLDLAISHCNSFFFFALNESINKNLIIESFKKSIYSNIGEHFFIKERAFQVKQQLKQFFDLHCDITEILPVNYQEQTKDHLKNLEGA